ncbi:MAG: hypothetical protein PHR35_11400 [Kiritimatiellae bacterium]|nr:hypothetical protein [Kiritimatiellia bacterium]
MKLDLPVMLMALSVAAALQALLPAMPWTPLKVPLLTAVALYYALRRQPARALTAALWAGILTDALGGVPPGVSALFLAAVALALLSARRVLPGEAWTTAALAGAAVAPLLAMAQYLALRRHWESQPETWPLISSWLLLAPAGALAAVAAMPLCKRLDVWAGNVQLKDEIANRDR